MSTMTKTATARPSGHGVLSRHHRLLPSYLEMVHRPALWSRPGVLWSSVERSGVLRAGQCGLIWSTVEHCLAWSTVHRSHGANLSPNTDGALWECLLLIN